MAACGLLLVVVYLFCRTNIYILLRYRRREGNDDVFIRIYAWKGILSYVMKVPVVQVDWRDEMLWFESEMKNTAGDQRINRLFERHVMKKVVDLICHHPWRFRRIRERIQAKLRQTASFVRAVQDKVRCDRFICRLRFGLEDAAATAMLAGGIWMLQGLVSNSMRQRMTSCPVWLITPLFGQNILLIDLECIFRVRLGNIINALYHTDKQGGSNRGGTSDSEHDENDHGKHQRDG